MLELSKEQLQKLRRVEIEITNEIDRICKKHNIQYFIAGGTLLGAVRHKGFIPWDDDMDVYMYRSEYEKFCAICQEEMDDTRFFWQTQETDRHYRWTYGKLRRKDTLYVREGQEHMKFFQGIFVDVIPFDKRSENLRLWSVQDHICRMWRRVLWSPVGARNEEKKVLKLWYSILSVIPRDWVYSAYKKSATHYNKSSSKKYFSFNVTWEHPYKDGIDEEWIKKTVELPFEDCIYPVPQNYHEFLRFYYDEYMKYPPVEERHGNCPVSSIKFYDE